MTSRHLEPSYKPAPLTPEARASMDDVAKRALARTDQFGRDVRRLQLTEARRGLLLERGVLWILVVALVAAAGALFAAVVA